MFVVIDEEKQAELPTNFILRHIKLSSCSDDPAVLGQAIRSNWTIENALR